MTLKLEISFGNDAMQTGIDAADAVRHVAQQLEDCNTSGYVRDANGNTVGYWSIDWEARDVYTVGA